MSEPRKLTVKRCLECPCWYESRNMCRLMLALGDELPQRSIITGFDATTARQPPRECPLKNGGVILDIATHQP